MFLRVFLIIVCPPRLWCGKSKGPPMRVTLLMTVPAARPGFFDGLSILLAQARLCTKLTLCTVIATSAQI